MKRVHIFGVVGLLTLIVILLGTVRSNLAAIQYLGNTTGVLLGFVLGVWWQEGEKERLRKEQQKESERIRKETIDQFWIEYKSFLLELEVRINALKLQCQNQNSIYDTVIEYRLPVPEALFIQQIYADKLVC